jgi:predicted dehydrogenase
MRGFTGAMGELSSLHSLIANQRPLTSVRDASTGEIQENVTKSAPDQIMMHGILNSGAVVSLHLRGGTSIDKGLRWMIYGEKGEIEITGWAALLHVNVPGVTWAVKVSNANGEITRSEDVGDVEGQPAVGRIYDAFAEGNKDGYADFEDGVVMHRIIQAMKDSSADGERKSYKQTY